MTDPEVPAGDPSAAGAPAAPPVPADPPAWSTPPAPGADHDPGSPQDSGTPQDPGTPPAPGAAQDQGAPQDPAADQDPGAPQDPGSPQDPAADQDPGAAAPRKRRRWPLITLAALVVVAGLAVGLVLWAPWTPPPVLRPAGLTAGPATANSISFHWSRPASGPLPDKYQILSDGTVAGSVAGTVTSYRQAGLTPATGYQFRVVAVRGGKRSPQSAVLAVRTVTPPISQARLQGSWNVNLKYLHPASRKRNGTSAWTLSPGCPTGACDVTLHAINGKYSFTMRLARAGARYQGQAVVNFYPCGPRGSSIPDPTTLRVRLRATDAVGQGQTWAATSWTGTMVGTYHYVSAATFYCSASSYTVSLTATQS